LIKNLYSIKKQSVYIPKLQMPPLQEFWFYFSGRTATVSLQHLARYQDGATNKWRR